MPLPTDKELINQFVTDTFEYEAPQLAIAEILLKYERFKASKTPKEIVDYEILTCEGPNGGEIHTMKNNCHLSGHPIHSVKRLSDGTVFIVGDETNKGKIQEFSVEDKRMMVLTEKEFWVMFYTLQHIPFKTPLLICNWDGTEIFDGDKFFTVDGNYDVHEFVADPSIPKSFSETNKTFGTEQAAKEYIDLNKPAYSLAQIKEAILDTHGATLPENIEKVLAALKKNNQ